MIARKALNNATFSLGYIMQKAEPRRIVPRVSTKHHELIYHYHCKNDGTEEEALHL